MVNTSKFLGLILLSALLASCSGPKASPRQMDVSFAALVANDLPGGAIVRVENAVTGAHTDYSVSAPPFKVLIPDGKWNIYFVGFVGPGAWAGATNCGASLGVVLGPTTTNINVAVDNDECANSPFVALIATKVSKWDHAIWDQSKWGP